MPLVPVDPELLVRGSEDDPRLGRCVVKEGAPASVVLVGAADDTGVRNSAGRTGASAAPTAIRHWLYRQTTGMNRELEGLSILDLGDVLPGTSIEDTHRELEEVVASHADTVVIVLGGGHDLSFGSQSGVFSSRKGRGAILNVDAHLDVRPLKNGTVITSGTPFRRVLERFADRVSMLEELGIQPQHNAATHAAWLLRRGGRIHTLEELRQPPGVFARMGERLEVAAQSADFVTVSIDLDGVAGAFAPGVSAPPADGLHPEELLAFAQAAGRQTGVCLFEVMELSPPHDENERTARLAAACVWRFLAGLAARTA